MELTNILGKLGSHEEPPKPFLALELTDDLVQAAVWHVKDGLTEVVALGTPVEWTADKDHENLVQAADATLSAALEGLEQEPSGVVFGLPAAWTAQEGIEPAKLELVKHLTRELELKPLGYVVIVDSLLRYLKLQEGTPSTSLLIQVGASEIVVHHVRLGRIEGREVVGKSDDVATDVEEGISRLKITGHLPSRIIVFDGMHNLEEIVQNLVSYDWQAKFEFLHLPKVESLPKDVVIRGIAIAGGAEVAKSLGFEINEPKKPIQADQASPASTTPTDDLVLTPAQDLGFSPRSEAKTPPAPSKAEPPPPKPTQPPRKLPKFPRLRLSLPTLPLPHPKLEKSLGLLVTVLILILGLGIAAVWYLPRATVALTIVPKLLQETVPLTLSTAATNIDSTVGTVPASLLETSVEGSGSAPATGTKTVGDPARGEVTIYNRTDLPKTFTKGTTLTAGKLKFTLDDDVAVASSSAGADYVEVPGKATVAITASSIGEEGNVGSDTEFTLDNYSQSTYVARNSSALSGGSSREVSVVSEKDLSALVENLSAKLAEQARQDLLSSAGKSAGIYLLADNLEVTNQELSADVGAEADHLELTLTVQVQGIRYQLEDVASLVASTIQASVPPGYLMTNALPQVELSSAEVKSEEEVSAEAKVEVPVLPQLDLTSLQTALRGLAGSEVESVLGTIPGLQSARVEITPKFLPPRLKKMPRNPNNITISIVSSN